jgi:hypothetical protein
VTLRKVTNSDMVTRGQSLTEKEDRKAKALGESRYNLLPNQYRQLDPSWVLQQL